jgi:hypothetical protein
MQAHLREHFTGKIVAQIAPDQIDQNIESSNNEMKKS